jgi:hypothetical protein
LPKQLRQLSVSSDFNKNADLDAATSWPIAPSKNELCSIQGHFQKVNVMDKRMDPTLQRACLPTKTKVRYFLNNKKADMRIFESKKNVYLGI